MKSQLKLIGKGEAHREGGPRTTILLVDDNNLVRNSIQKILEIQDDFKVIGVAANGEEAVQYAQQTLPQVILMDVNMPIMDGIEATKKIKSTMAETCIVGLSLHDSQEVVNSMSNAGASAYINKSNIINKLCPKIRRAMKLNKKNI